jgi:hypothetical protein
MRQVTLLYFDGCPNWRTADARLRAVVDEIAFDLQYEQIDTPEAAVRRSFRGSPTILVDGVDVFARGDEPVGLACRVYQTPDGPAGAPTLDQLRAVLR